MREILFRAKIKVKVNNPWYTEEEIQFLESKLHDVVSIRFDNYSCISHISVAYGKTVMTAIAEYCDIELMEYTGVKDMYGQKIFKGDIMHDGYDTTAVVKYDDKDAMFTIVYANICTNFGNWAVIGDIYNNPELLEDKKCT